MNIRNIVVIGHEPVTEKNTWVVLGVSASDVRFIDSASSEAEAHAIKKKIEDSFTQQEWDELGDTCQVCDIIMKQAD